MKLTTLERISLAWRPSELTQATPMMARCQLSWSPISAAAMWNWLITRARMDLRSCRLSLSE